MPERRFSERPIVRNLLFVQATELRMRQLKQDYNTLLQFKVKPQMGGGYVPVIVPDKQMEDFMACAAFLTECRFISIR